MLSLKNVKVPIDNKKDLKDIIATYLHVNSNKIKSYKIHKESIDARPKHEFCYIYEFWVEIENEEKYLSKNITKVVEEKYIFPKSGTKKLENRPVIIGLGPAGLFAAYELAKHGYKPVVFERGKCIEERVKDVEEFWKSGKLNKNSNVQFGEGGAGTFSDGKLNTLVKNKENRMTEVFDVFVKFGAPLEITYSNHPHIGTDRLREVIKNMREQIISWGGEINYNSLLEDLIIADGKVKGIVINGKEIKTEVVVLAIGHSARDTFSMLLSKNIEMMSKPFAVGVRIVHPQELIDKHQYPKLYQHLPASSYKLTYMSSDSRGVYSFCMCPGGYVVNASSEKASVVTNGMSNYKRDSGFANSAIIVTVNERDYGTNALDGLKFMESIERKTYELTNGDLAIQKFKDYENNKISDKIDCQNFVKGNVSYVNINNILPEYINVALKEGINYFNTKIPGFNEGVIIAPETRTSSPVRIVRGNSLESNIKGIYPCGEGSGYAGGITTSAMDGIKVAEEIAKKYDSINIK